MQGAVGKQLDIRPPMQPLALLNGSQRSSPVTAALFAGKHRAKPICGTVW